MMMMLRLLFCPAVCGLLLTGAATLAAAQEASPAPCPAHPGVLCVERDRP